MKKNGVGLIQVKQALKDGRFRSSLPAEFNQDIQKYLNNPGCACNVPIYRRILKEAKEQLASYFPGQEILEEEKEVSKLAENHWSVINCHIDELESRLRKLPPGRKQLDVARFEDQVTVVVNELEEIW